ncbi:cholinesterase-like [Amblyomma americanum]
MLVSIAACVVMATGFALVVAGITMGLLIPGPDGGCPPLDDPLEDGTVMVATDVGRLIGRMMTVDGTRLSRFFGVPFAESTEGERRFALPVPLSTSSSCRRRDCLEPREPCAQLGPNDSLVGSEDCLHANVWAPDTPPPSEGSRTLVVGLDGVWFEGGSNDHPDWPQLAARGDLVVMVPNYRLGVLGFLHPPHSGAKDVAVDDVMSALRWARANAAAFHADPDQLVVVGRGSGAYLLSVALRLMPNDTARRALYHGLVFGSLLPLEPADPTEPFRSLAKELACSSTEKSAWLACFRAAPLQQLLVASRASRLPLRFVPRLDLGMLQKSAATWPHTVLAGSDEADAVTLFSDVILPLAKRKGNATNKEAVLDYVIDLFNIPSYAKAIVRQKLRISAVEEIGRHLAMMMTVCPTLRVAQAAPEGFHYHYEAAAYSGVSFRPPLGVGQVAQFASKGSAAGVVVSSGLGVGQGAGARKRRQVRSYEHSTKDLDEQQAPDIRD